MCDYSLHHVASRPAKVGDKLVTTQFNNSITRGFAAVGEPSVAVCLLPGTEVAFEKEVEFERGSGLFSSWKREKRIGDTARNRAAVAGFCASCERSGGAKARFARPVRGCSVLGLEVGRRRIVGVAVDLGGAGEQPTGAPLVDAAPVAHARSTCASPNLAPDRCGRRHFSRRAIPMIAKASGKRPPAASDCKAQARGDGG